MMRNALRAFSQKWPDFPADHRRGDFEMGEATQAREPATIAGASPI